MYLEIHLKHLGCCWFLAFDIHSIDIDWTASRSKALKWNVFKWSWCWDAANECGYSKPFEILCQSFSTNFVFPLSAALSIYEFGYFQLTGFRFSASISFHVCDSLLPLYRHSTWLLQHMLAIFVDIWEWGQHYINPASGCRIQTHETTPVLFIELIGWMQLMEEQFQEVYGDPAKEDKPGRRVLEIYQHITALLPTALWEISTLPPNSVAQDGTPLLWLYRT